MKRLLMIVFVIALCLSLSGYAMAALILESGELSPVDTYVTKTLALNTELMEDAFSLNSAIRSYRSPVDSIGLSISQDMQTAVIQLTYNNIPYVGALSGESESVSTNNIGGYVGVFEGDISPVAESDKLMYEPIHLIIDVTFSSSEMFAALTFGIATATEHPQILFFGDLSDGIGTISNEYSTRTMNAYAEELDQLDIGIIEGNNVSPAQTTVDASIAFQSYDSIYAGSYKVGALSIFHANELRNQGSMTVRVKANSNTENLELYLRNQYGYSVTQLQAAAPDKFNMSMRGNHDDLHVSTNGYSPQDEETSVNLIVPVKFGDSIWDVVTVQIPVTMTSTTATSTKYSSDSPYDNNGIQWELYRLNGFSESQMDGDHTTQTGMTVEASYTYEGNITSNVTRSMNSSASVRYVYWVTINGITSTFHFTTGTMSTISYVTIAP